MSLKKDATNTAGSFFMLLKMPFPILLHARTHTTLYRELKQLGINTSCAITCHQTDCMSELIILDETEKL